jgi:hypothetical protein
VLYYIYVHRYHISINNRLLAFNGHKGNMHDLALALDDWFEPNLPLNKQHSLYDSTAAPPTNEEFIELIGRAEVVQEEWVGIAHRTVREVPEFGLLRKLETRNGRALRAPRGGPQVGVPAAGGGGG